MIIRKIKDYPDYEIWSDGRVKSNKNGKGVFLKATTDTRGYLQVTLYNKHGRKSHMVHKLVADAFLKNPNNYKVVNHKDGNKKNNRLLNIERCDHSHNNRHIFKIGKRKRKLSVEEVIEIKRLLNRNYTHKEIADKFKVHRVTITNINSGKTWSYVDEV